MSDLPEFVQLDCDRCGMQWVWCPPDMIGDTCEECGGTFGAAWWRIE